MKDKCIFNDNTYIYRLFGIAFLIIILIASIIYYLYITKKNIKKDKFINSSESQEVYSETPVISSVPVKSGIGCYVSDQGPMNITTRPCSVYFTENEDTCDKYEKYYNMNSLELDNEISQNKSNSELYKILLDIKNDKINNLNKYNVNSCKYTYNNWKEINSVNDPDFPNANIYPRKNINRTGDNNFNLINTCFKEYNTDVVNGKSSTTIDINTDKIISSKCDNPIANITDYNYNKKNQQYLAVNFNNTLSYNDIYNNVCSNPPKYNLTINDKYIIKFTCDNTNNNSVINDISIIRYDNNNNNFIEENNKQIIDYIIGNFFRISYNNSSKYIYYGNKQINTNAYMCKYDICNNIKDIILYTISFSFKDFNINDENIVLINVNELTNDLDTNIDNTDNTVDYYNKLKERITVVQDNILNNNNQIADDISNINGEISSYNSLINDFDTQISSLQKNIDENINNIKRAQEDTDFAIQTLRDAVAAAKAANAQDISNKNRNNEIIQANIVTRNAYKEAKESLKNERETTISNNKANYNLAIESYNSSKPIYDIAINLYNQTSKTYNDGMANIANTYINGLYFTKKDYNNGAFVQKWMQNQSDFTNSLNANSHFRKNTIIVPAPREPFFHDYDSSHISLFGTVNNYDYFTIEVSGNIKFTKTGFYHFMINADDAADMFLVYRDSSDNLIYKNVANYYNGHPPDMGSGACVSTSYPIFIDASINNGYYGLYIRLQELWGGSYLHPYFTLVTEDVLYSGQSYNLMKDTFSYIPYVQLSKTIKQNMKSLNLLNGSTNSYYINKNINDYTNKNFYIKSPPQISPNPGPEPIKPELPITPDLINLQEPIYQRPTYSSSDFTPIQIPTEYVDNSATDISELEKKRDKIKNDYQSTIDTDKTQKGNKMQQKLDTQSSIDIKNKLLDIKKNNYLSNNEKLKNISDINDKLQKFNNFMNYNTIKSLINKGIQINTYDKYIFEDNLNNKFIYLQVNFN